MHNLAPSASSIFLSLSLRAMPASFKLLWQNLRLCLPWGSLHLLQALPKHLFMWLNSWHPSGFGSNISTFKHPFPQIRIHGECETQEKKKTHRQSLGLILPSSWLPHFPKACVNLPFTCISPAMTRTFIIQAKSSNCAQSCCFESGKPGGCCKCLIVSEWLTLTLAWRFWPSRKPHWCMDSRIHHAHLDSSTKSTQRESFSWCAFVWKDPGDFHPKKVRKHLLMSLLVKIK